MKQFLILSSLFLSFNAEAAFDDKWAYTDEGFHGLPAIQIENFTEDETQPTYQLGINCISDDDYTIDLVIEGLFDKNEEVSKVYYYFFDKDLENYFEFIGKENSQYHFQLPKEKRVHLIRGFNRNAEFGDAESLIFEAAGTFYLETYVNWYEIGTPLYKACGETTKQDEDKSMSNGIAAGGLLFLTPFLFLIVGVLIGIRVIVKRFKYYKGFDIFMSALIYLTLTLAVISLLLLIFLLVDWFYL
jgi:hypothetical protein